jgi:4-amino-4-deoxy-L-arabinose transferase-like glycosyltransferase
LALVLTALAIGVWLLFSRQFVQRVTRLPWLGGFVLTVLIAGPWYWAAERKTPGFLDYFLIGEHIKRFLVPGWKGDMYGNAHIHSHGTIWLYLLYMLIPWTLLIPGFLFFSTGRFSLPRRDNPALAWVAPGERAWISYLLC